MDSGSGCPGKVFRKIPFQHFNRGLTLLHDQRKSRRLFWHSSLRLKSLVPVPAREDEASPDRKPPGRRKFGSLGFGPRHHLGRRHLHCLGRPCHCSSPLQDLADEKVWRSFSWFPPEANWHGEVLLKLKAWKKVICNFNTFSQGVDDQTEVWNLSSLRSGQRARGWEGDQIKDNNPDYGNVWRWTRMSFIKAESCAKSLSPWDWQKYNKKPKKVCIWFKWPNLKIASCVSSI